MVKVKLFYSKHCDYCEKAKRELKKLKKKHKDWKISSQDLDKKDNKNIDVMPTIVLCAKKKCAKIEGVASVKEIEKVVKQM